MKVQIITIGDELLIGQVIDTNSAWMGQELNKVGFEIDKITSISDEEKAITTTLRTALEAVDVVLLTGGLGPTKDDITKKVLADFYNAKMVFDESTFNRIQRLFDKLGRSTTDAHLQQAYMPDKATILLNKMGTAPGMWFEEEGKVVVSMPGVPYEMKYLMEAEVIPKLLKQFQGTPLVHRTICTVGEGESRLAKRLTPFLDTLPDFINVAYLPGTGIVRIRLTARGENETELQQLLEEKVKEIEAIIPEFIFGFDKESLETALGAILQKQNKMLALAESCTGGYIAQRITSKAGCSAYFAGGFVTYSNKLKMDILGVKPKTLEEHGAVSEQTVLEMLEGCLKRTEADVAIAVSGIAGPSGGTPDKPVGTIWVAVGNLKEQRTRLLQLGKDRTRNIEYTATQALNMVRELLKGE
ncbi:MAG: nicotinamide-nucleotide amidase [Polaribacter sp.]|jgi:nicotinamide-nucleotide amidase